MIPFDPEQALSHYIELHKKQGQEIDQRPDLQRMMNRGHDDFSVNADWAIRAL